MKKIVFFSCLLLAFFFRLYAQIPDANGEDCYSILAGKDATADGSVMLAHNEDGPGFILINWYKTPSRHADTGTYIVTETAVTIPQVEKINGTFWLEMPDYSFSDSYMNDKGVVIASNQCKSREDNPSLTSGGIGYWLRRLMAERAGTAREAVKLGGKLIEQYGYLSSGRTYCIADSKEAWMMSVVKGKHWVACRIPDDRVAMIPNYYTIEGIDLTDTVNCLGSADIIDYAVRRGWYDPSSGQPFSFRLAYGEILSLNDIKNIARHWQGVNLLAEQPYTLHERLPFAFKPKEKLSTGKLFQVLGDHYENTALQPLPGLRADPHQSDTMRICSDRNQYGFVAQLRSWMPVAVGSVLWLAPPRPCMQPFIPWYCGIETVPPVYSGHDADYAIAHHFDKSRTMLEPCDHAYCAFLNYAAQVNKSYPASIIPVKEYKNNRQAEIEKMQKKMEKKVLRLYERDPQRALKILTDFTSDLAVEEYKRTASLSSPTQTRPLCP
jgi:dipeptidase